MLLSALAGGERLGASPAVPNGAGAARGGRVSLGASASCNTATATTPPLPQPVRRSRASGRGQARALARRKAAMLHCHMPSTAGDQALHTPQPPTPSPRAARAAAISPPGSALAARHGYFSTAADWLQRRPQPRPAGGAGLLGRVADWACARLAVAPRRQPEAAGQGAQAARTAPAAGSGIAAGHDAVPPAPPGRAAPAPAPAPAPS